MSSSSTASGADSPTKAWPVVERARRVLHELEDIAADMASRGDRGDRRGPVRLDRHHRTVVAPPAAHPDGAPAPGCPGDRPRGEHHGAGPPRGVGPPRRRRRAPADRRSRRGGDAPVRRRPGAALPTPSTRWPNTTPSACRHSPTSLCSCRPPARRCGGSSTGRAGAVDTELTPQAEIDGVRLLTSLRVRGLRRRDRAGHRDPPVVEGRFQAHRRARAAPDAWSGGCNASGRRPARPLARSAKCSAKWSTSRANVSPACTWAPRRSRSAAIGAAEPPPGRGRSPRARTPTPPPLYSGRPCRPSPFAPVCPASSAPMSATWTGAAWCGSMSMPPTARGALSLGVVVAARERRPDRTRRTHPAGGRGPLQRRRHLRGVRPRCTAGVSLLGAIASCSGIVPTIMIVDGPAVSGPALLIGLADLVVIDRGLVRVR